MRKRVVLTVPRYLKKYLLNPEFGELAEDGSIYVGRRSLVGSYISSIARPIPFVLPKTEAGGLKLMIWYSCRERTHEVAPDKLVSLARSLDEIFRRSLICEVRALHELCGGDYSRFIRSFLSRYQIEPDVDIDFDTARKIYRDYLDRIDKSIRETEKNILS